MKYFILVIIVTLTFSCKKKKVKIDDALVFRYNEHKNIGSLDPAFSKDIADIWATNQLFNGLVQMDENLQTLCMEWPLALDYDGTRQTPRQTTITAHAVGFVLTQIISRRGPGGLRFFLEKYG